MPLFDIQPMPLVRRPLPFDDPDWIFELKLDGFRALAVLENGKCQLLSRNGHAFASFAGLGKSLAASLPDAGYTVLDGEIVCIDESGKPQFYDLLFHHGDPSFFVFDLLISNGKDWRQEQLMDRKKELRRLLSGMPVDCPLAYVDYVEGQGTALFQRICELDLEGIVAKHKHSPYIGDRERSTWFKLQNRGYSQMKGREQLFERDRHREPVPGWHSCALVCDEIDPEPLRPAHKVRPYSARPSVGPTEHRRSAS
jgi:bifunctional non-homologous end joining protein LigD